MWKGCQFFDLKDNMVQIHCKESKNISPEHKKEYMEIISEAFFLSLSGEIYEFPKKKYTTIPYYVIFLERYFEKSKNKNFEKMVNDHFNEFNKKMKKLSHIQENLKEKVVDFNNEVVKKYKDLDYDSFLENRKYYFEKYKKFIVEKFELSWAKQNLHLDEIYTELNYWVLRCPITYFLAVISPLKRTPNKSTSTLLSMSYNEIFKKLVSDVKKIEALYEKQDSRTNHMWLIW